MIYVLVVVTVFTASGSVATQTRFHEFSSHAACEVARVGIGKGVLQMKGTMGRELFAACYPKE